MGEYRPKRLKVRVEEIELKNYQKDNSNIIGGNWTFLALKNPKSFLIGTKGYGLKLIDNGFQVYTSAVTNATFTSLLGMIYIETKDYYLMGYNGKIYRKNIDSKDPYLFIDLKIGVRIGACFRFSKLNNRLITIREKHWISMVDLETKTVDAEIKNLRVQSIWDFKIFDEKEKSVISVTKGGLIEIFKMNYLTQGGYTIDHHDLELNRSMETASSLAVCVKSRNVLVLIKNLVSSNSTRMVIFELNKRRLIMNAQLSLEGERIPEQFSLDCHTYAGQKILWVGLSTTRYGSVHVYEYDTQSSELRELSSTRAAHKEIDPVSFHRHRNWYYYTGSLGKLMRFKLKM